MASSIKLEAICVSTHLPHGFLYYIYSSFVSSMCGVLKYCGPVACKLNTCVYALLILGAVSQQILIQDCRPCDVKCIESDSHSSIYTMFLLGIINAMMNLNLFGCLVIICVETNWPSN